MENKMVNVMVKFSDKKRVNNMEIPVVSIGSVDLSIDRKLERKLTDVSLAFKELGTVIISLDGKKLGILNSTSYSIEDNTVTFQRFGGTIQRDFFEAITDMAFDIAEAE